MSKDANKKFYFDLVPDADVGQMMSEIGEMKCHADFWMKNKEDKSEEFESLAYDPEKKLLYFEKKSSGLMGSLLPCKFIDKGIFLKIEYKKVFVFTTGFLNRENEGDRRYYVKIENQIYTSKQRTNYRLMASRNVNIQIKVDEEIYNCLDISAGGTSFKVDVSQDEDFNKGDIFKDCEVLFNKKKFIIPEIQIMGKWEEKSPHSEKVLKYKLGIAFTKLAAQTEEDLFKHVNSEARAEEIRRKMLEQKLANGDKPS